MTSTASSASVPPSPADLAAAVVHELRTPLTALSGEVELALRRERSVEYYQAAFARLAERTAELLDLTSDFAFLGTQQPADGAVHAASSLGAVFESLTDRFARRPTAHVEIEPVMGEQWVEGEEPLVTGAIAVLIDLAVRTRRDGARIRFGVDGPADDLARETFLDVTLAAEPGGRWPLDSRGDRFITSANLVLFTAAANTIERCRGSAALVAFPTGERLRIRLRRAERREVPAR